MAIEKSFSLRFVSPFRSIWQPHSSFGCGFRSEIHTLQTDQAPVFTLSFSPNGKWLAAGDDSGRVRSYPFSGEAVIRERAMHRELL